MLEVECGCGVSGVTGRASWMSYSVLDRSSKYSKTSNHVTIIERRKMLDHDAPEFLRHGHCLSAFFSIILKSSSSTPLSSKTSTVHFVLTTSPILLPSGSHSQASAPPSTTTFISIILTYTIIATAQQRTYKKCLPSLLRLKRDS